MKSPYSVVNGRPPGQQSGLQLVQFVVTSDAWDQFRVVGPELSFKLLKALTEALNLGVDGLAVPAV